MARINAATRLAAVLSRIEQTPVGVNALEGWSRVLNVPVSNALLSEWEIARCLNVLKCEVALIRRFMRNAALEPDTYEPILEKASQILTLQLLGAGWQDVRQRLPPELVASFRLLAQFMPDDGERLTEEEVNSLVEEIHGFRKGIEDGTLPERLKHFLIEQLDLMLRAVREHNLRGGAALEEAGMAAVSKWAHNADVLSPFLDAPEVQAVKNLWSKVEKACKRTILVGAALTAVLAPIDKAIEVAGRLHSNTLPAPSQISVPPCSTRFPFDALVDRLANAQPTATGSAT